MVSLAAYRRVYNQVICGLTHVNSSKLDLDPMTLIYDLNLDILQMYMHTKMKILSHSLQKLE